MSGHLLDTSVLIAAAEDAGAMDLPATAAISVVSLGELRAGVLLARGAATADARAARLAAIRSAFVAIPVDDAVADAYGAVLAAARAARRLAKATDLLIIATAMVTERMLHTRDEAQAGLAGLVGVPVSRP